MSKRDDGELLGREGSGTIHDRMETLGERIAPPGHTHRGLLHLAAVVGLLCALACIPYASADLRMWQPWLPEDGIPVVRLFDQGAERLDTGMGLATGGAVGASWGSNVADTLGEAIAANLEGPEAPPLPAEPPSDRAGHAEPEGPSVRIDPSELEGLVLELEDPSGRAMRPFYEQLLRTAERRDHAITHVAHYGDSSIAGDGITVTLRRRLQQRFGDAGHGFVLIARGTMPYRHQDLSHSARGPWNLDQLVRAGRRDHRYGYGGVLYRGLMGTSARFGTSDRGPVGGAVSRFELWYQRHPRGGRVDLRVDEGERVVLNTRGEGQEDAWHVIEVPDDAHRIELRTRGGGVSRLYGMVLEREGPGVVYDSLGMVGARARRMLGMDPDHFATQHAHRQTNLIVLAFGGNDADDVRRTGAQFENDFRRVARLVRRARPEAACLLMAPLDQARRTERGRIRTMDRIPIIVEAQRRAAAAEGCAFFDTFAAMGGEGAMRRWYRSRPRLAFGDYRHATPAGYRVIGNMFYKALLKGFSDFLQAQ